MARHALLIGVSDYAGGIGPLSAPLHDVEALASVLRDEKLGGFQVEILRNPSRQQMEETVYSFLGERVRSDVALLYFSGHGLKDDLGKLYLATSNTRLDAGNLVKPTAVASSWILQMLQESRCQQQIVILDCCFSGAFGDHYMGKGVMIDVGKQIAGVDNRVSSAQRKAAFGRVTMSSSNASNYSLEDKAASCSLYTKILIEGITTGEADLDHDGRIEAQELHDYVSEQLHSVRPDLSPKIYPWGEGYKLVVAQAVVPPKPVEETAPVEEAIAGPTKDKSRRRAYLGILAGAVTFAILALAYWAYLASHPVKPPSPIPITPVPNNFSAAAPAPPVATPVKRPSLVPVPNDCELSVPEGAIPLCQPNFEFKKNDPGYACCDAAACLDDVALSMQQDSSKALMVVGEGTYDEDYPAEVGAKRAMTVQNYLVREKRIDPSRVIMRAGPVGIRDVHLYLLPSQATADRFACVSKFDPSKLRVRFHSVGDK